MNQMGKMCDFSMSFPYNYKYMQASSNKWPKFHSIPQCGSEAANDKHKRGAKAIRGEAGRGWTRLETPTEASSAFIRHILAFVLSFPASQFHTFQHHPHLRARQEQSLAAGNRKGGETKIYRNR
jgi:hypothetical protein